MSDALYLALMVAAFLLVLVALGLIADAWESAEARDARERNHGR